MRTHRSHTGPICDREGEVSRRALLKGGVRASNRLLCSTTAAGIIAAVVSLAAIPAAGQPNGVSVTRFGERAAGCPMEPAKFHPCAMAKIKTFNPPRTPDGHPDMQGSWKRTRTAQDIEDHPFDGVEVAAETSMVVEPADGKVPYQPWAAAQKKENLEKYISPGALCFVAGVPRFTYFEDTYIVQRPGYVTFFQEIHSHPYRFIPTDGRPHIGKDIKLWDGDSRGRWEGNTLVIDVTNLTDRTWFDHSGNFHSDEMHVVERYTMVDINTIHWEATIEDPKVFTRPWKMAMPLKRDQDKTIEFMEEACWEESPDWQHLTSAGYKLYPGVRWPKPTK